MRLVAELRSLGWDDTLLRVAVAAALGGAIGLERELDEKAAGLRTHMLVSIGSALFTLVGAYGFAGFANGSVDPSRIAAQIVTGIGFLGAGAILRSGKAVHGMTTAATIWVNAAIGMAAGAGQFMLATITAALTLAVLALLPPIEIYFEHRAGWPDRHHDGPPDR